MAGKVVGFRIKLEGEKATIDALNAVKDALGKNGKAIDEINKKADALDKTTRRVIELTKALSELNKVQPIVGVPNVPRVTINNRTTGTPTPTNTTDDREEKERRYQAELLKTLRIQEQQLKELALLGDKESQTYKDLLLNVAKSKVTLSELTKEVKAQQREFEGVKIASGSYRQLNAELGRLRAAYKDLSEAERNGAIGRETLQSIVKLDRELKKLDANIGLYQRNVGNYANAFNNLSTIAQRVSGVFGIAFGLDEVIRNNAQLSDSLGDVRRVTQLSQKSVEDLYNSLRKIDTRTSLDGLLQISVIGGKLGVSEKNLAGFTEAANKLQVALGKELGDNVEETTTKLAKLVTIFDKDKTVTGDKLIALGNGIAYLANKGTATGEFLADFSNRLAGLSGIANISLGQTLGLGAGFQELGQSAEVSSTAVTTLILKIGQDVPKFAGLAGKSVAEFSKTINEKPVEALLQLSEGLVKNKTGFVEISKEFKEAEAGGKRIAATLGVLGKNADFFRGKITDGSAALLRQNELLAAYEIKNQTAGAALDKLKKSIIDVTTSTDFQKFLFDVITAFTKFIQVLGALPKFIKENKLEILLLASAYLAVDRNLITLTQTNLRAIFVNQLLADGTTKLALVTRIFNNVLKASPILLALAGVYLIIKAYDTWANRIDATRIAYDALKNIQSDVNAEAGKELSKLKQYIDILKAEKTSIEQKKAAKDALIAQYPDYFKGVDLDIAKGEKLTEIQNDLTKAIIKTAAARVRDKLTGELSDKFIEKKLRRDAVAGGDALTASESFSASNTLRASKPNPINGFGQIAVATSDIKKQFLETEDKELVQIEIGITKITDGINKTYDLTATKATETAKVVKAEGQGVGVAAEHESKAEAKRREKADKERVKEESERQKFERAAAENIFRIRKELADKTFDFQKKEAALEFQESKRKIENEYNDAVKKLSGTASEVAAEKAIYKNLYDTQIDLSGKLLQKRNNDINKAYEAARAAALKDIEESRREFLLKQANNTVKNIEATGQAQNRVFDLQTVTTEISFDAKKSQLEKEFNDKAVFTIKSEKELTAKLKVIENDKEQALLDIRKRAFEYNKTQKTNELNAQIAEIKQSSKNQLAAITQSETDKKDKLAKSLKDKLITQKEYQKELIRIEEEAKAKRLQNFLDGNSQIGAFISQLGLDTIKTAQEIANKEVDIARNKTKEITADREKALDKIIAERNAKLDLLETFAAGSKGILEGISNHEIENIKAKNKALLDNASLTAAEKTAIEKKQVEEEAAVKRKYGGILKALAIAEIAINLQRQISNIATGITKDTSTLGLFGTAFSTVLGAIRSVAAIAQAAFATQKVLSTKFEYGGIEPSNQKSDSVQGGVIPSESGVIQGKSHTEGGVKVKNRYGNLYEVEGGEYRLRNGKETYIINKESTRRYKSELDTLSKILRPTIFSAKRKEIASSINSQNGVKFAQGGIAPNDIPQFNTPQIGAPLPPTQQNVTVVNTSIETSQEVIDMLSETQRMIEAVNSRIDRIVVINKPEEVYEQALLQKEIRSTQNL